MRTVVVLPTYNESENLEPFVRSLRTVSASIDVLVVDDASPDGTSALAVELAAELGGIDILDRPERRGLGSAYRDGFARALAAGYDTVISMDADLSHDPADVPTMLRRLREGADVVIGSRYVPGGGTRSWSWYRRVLSRCGNAYARVALGLPMRDCTSGFRAYRRAALIAIEPATTGAEGYAFLTELAHRTSRHELEIVETPIIFRDRTRGDSKMSSRIIVESMVRVTRWAVAERIGRITSRRPSDASTGAARRGDEDGDRLAEPEHLVEIDDDVVR